MKKPINMTGVSDDMVVVHQLVEALDDQALQDMSDNGWHKYISKDRHLITEELSKADISNVEAASIGMAAALGLVHWAIHDLLTDEPDLRDIEDERTRKIALDHVPYTIESKLVPQEVKDELNRILKRK